MHDSIHIRRVRCEVGEQNWHTRKNKKQLLRIILKNNYSNYEKHIT